MKAPDTSSARPAGGCSIVHGRLHPDVIRQRQALKIQTFPALGSASSLCRHSYMHEDRRVGRVGSTAKYESSTNCNTSLGDLWVTNIYCSSKFHHHVLWQENCDTTWECRTLREFLLPWSHYCTRVWINGGEADQFVLSETRQPTPFRRCCSSRKRNSSRRSYDGSSSQAPATKSAGLAGWKQSSKIAPKTGKGAMLRAGADCDDI